MCEMTRQMTITFGESDCEYFARIENEGCITSHSCKILDIPNEDEAILVFITEALGMNPAQVLNFAIYDEDEEAYK